MQSSGVLLGAEDSAERNDLLRRGFEVSVGSAQMLRSEMGQLIESFGKELETFKQRKKKLSEEMVELTASTARENELMTNELRTSMEARKQLITNRIRASTKSEKESLNTSIEALKQLTEMINELRVSAETEKELLTKELKSSREAVKQLSQELNEVRASTDREKESLNTSKEALKQLSEMMNELRVSAEKEKELLTKKLKSSREAVKQLSQENNELRAAAPSDEYDETDSSSPTLFKKFKGFFVSSKSTTPGRRSHQKTQLKELEVTSEASRDREKELPTNELQAPRRHLSQNKSERKASGKRLKEEQGSVKEMEKLRAVSPSNECDQPGASRPTLFRKFKGFFVSSKSTRQGRRSHQKTPKELKSNTEASSGMQLLAGPSHEDHHEYVQEHEERTDRLEILESKKVEMDITASSGRCKASPSLVKNADSGKRCYKVMDSQKGLESDGEKQSSGKVPTSRSVNNHVRKNLFNVETAMECNQTTDRQPSFGGDGTLQQISGFFIYQGAYCGTDVCSHCCKQICGNPSQSTGQLSPLRLAQSLPLLPCQMDIRDLPNSGIKIEQQPESKKQQEGSKVIFELKVQEQDKYSYQWLKDGAELEGKCDAILILDNVELREFGWYRCRVCSRENFGINCESSRAWLDVVPKVQKGTRLKKFTEVDLPTCDRIAFYLDKDVPYGLGGNRQAAAVFGMTKDTIGALATSKSPGQVIVEFVKATKPDITVYEVFKQFKGDEMKRFDIAKILENHLTITESAV